MPRAQVAFVRRHSRTCGYHSRFRAKVRDDDVIPRVAVLVAKDDKVIRHGVAAIRRLEPITQLHRFAESGLGEMDMINVGSFTSPGRRRAARSGLWRSLAVDKR